MKIRSAAKWGGGFIFSFLFIWMISSIFVNSVVPLEWDSQLTQYVSRSGAISRFRSEGWADTTIGVHGLTDYGTMVLKQDGRKFILWGDSYAEAMQVPGHKRAVNILNTMPGQIKGFTVAGGGLGGADYYFNIPRYEKLSDDIVGHVILLADMADMMPGKNIEGHSRFLSEPWRLEECSLEPSRLALDLAHVVNVWRVDFLHGVYRAIKDYKFRFYMASPKALVLGSSLPLELLDSAWKYFLDRFKEQTQGFIVFVYIPSGPRMINGEVEMVDSGLALKERFRSICEQKGVGFLDLSQPFADLYIKQGLLPRGFFNSPPGTGHLNEYGHRIVAEKLHKYLDMEGL